MFFGSPKYESSSEHLRSQVTSEGPQEAVFSSLDGMHFLCGTFDSEGKMPSNTAWSGRHSPEATSVELVFGQLAPFALPAGQVTGKKKGGQTDQKGRETLAEGGTFYHSKRRSSLH